LIETSKEEKIIRSLFSQINRAYRSLIHFQDDERVYNKSNKAQKSNTKLLNSMISTIRNIQM